LEEEEEETETNRKRRPNTMQSEGKEKKKEKQKKERTPPVYTHCTHTSFIHLVHLHSFIHTSYETNYTH
jgi:hypothetical protein